MLVFVRKIVTSFVFIAIFSNPVEASISRFYDLIVFSTKTQPEVSFYNDRPVKFHRKGEPPKYLKIGVGVGVWYVALQPHFEPYRRPLSIFVEYRKDTKPFSYAVEANILSIYAFGQFQLKPMYFCVYPKVNLSGFVKLPKWFDAYALAGGQVAYSRFTENEYSGIAGYNHKVESSIKPGVIVGAGLSFIISRFEISPRISFQSGSGDYYAGYFTKQHFNTSTINAIVYMAYKFPIFQHKPHCPAYR
ncbi:MAG TPA: hypothetical protein DIW31_03220 [Bacteroidales bacterium]|nr:hypothetical protein [Bacteroidales bacterium]